MVGLNEFGEAAWSYEQLFNNWLAEQRPASVELINAADTAMQAFGRWVEDISTHSATAWNAQDFRRSADALRLEGKWVPLQTPAAAPAQPVAAVEEPQPVSVQEDAFDPMMQTQPFHVDTVAFQVAASEAAASEAPAPQDVVDFASTQTFGFEPTQAFQDSRREPAQATEVTEIDFGEFDFVGKSAEPAAHSQPAPAEVLEPEPLPQVSAQPEPEQETAAGALADEAPLQDLDLHFTPVPDQEPAPVADLPEVVEVPHAVQEPVYEEPQDLVLEEPQALPESVLEALLEPSAVQAPQDVQGVESEALPAAELQTQEEPVLEAPLDELELATPDLVQAVESPSMADADVHKLSDVPDVVPAPDMVSEPEVVEVHEVPQAPEAMPVLEVVEVPEVVEVAEAVAEADEQVKVIGHLRLSIPLYNVYLNEADEWSRRLQVELSEWAMELQRPLPDSVVALAHSLLGSSATVGFVALSEMARALEHALQHVQLHRQGTPEQAATFSDAAEDIRRLLHQFAAGFLKETNARVLAALQAIIETEFPEATMDSIVDALDEDMALSDDEELHVPEVSLPSAPVASVELPSAAPLSVVAAPLNIAQAEDDDEIDAVDHLDEDLFPIFEEEAIELMPQLGSALRHGWPRRII